MLGVIKVKVYYTKVLPTLRNGFCKPSGNPKVSYQPIENYGIIGDLNTVALVGLHGSIDFMCYPQFDSPSIFAALLDDKKGGCYSISPEFTEMKTKQLYLPDTNVLLTRFLSADGVGEVTDFMPVDPVGEKRLIRRVTTVRGEVKYRLRCCPRFNYGRDVHRITQKGPKELLFHADGPNGLTLRLRGSIDLQINDLDATAEFSLPAGQTVSFLLESASNQPLPRRILMIRSCRV